VQCNQYSQGCAGGFPFLVEKFAYEFGLTKSGKCAKSESQLKKHRELGETDEADASEPYVRVTNFGYVGGYYGGTTVKEMMKEVYKNGPIVVGINGGYELMHYDSGVFIQTGEGTGEGKVKNDFETVDHAVVVVGWGKGDDGSKHWIIKNSFGAGWGEKGYFRIPLKGDMDGITSLVTQATPVLGNAEYFQKSEHSMAEAPAGEQTADAKKRKKVAKKNGAAEDVTQVEYNMDDLGEDDEDEGEASLDASTAALTAPALGHGHGS